VAVVRVRPYAEAAPLVGVPHQPVDRGDQFVAVGGGQGALEVLHDRRVHDRHLALVDGAGGAVDRDDVTLLDRHAAGHARLPGLGVDLELFGAADAGLAHAAGDDRGVGGLAAA